MPRLPLEEKYWVGFAFLPNIGPVSFKKIKRFFNSLEEAWNCTSPTAFIKAGLSAKAAEALITAKREFSLETLREELAQEEIKIILSSSPLYPPQLKEIKSAPFVLFCRGNPKILSHKQLAVVGTRRPTSYGQQVIQRLIPSLTQAGLAITSGLAQGIDSLAHQAALSSGTSTIAVLGNGLKKDLLRRALSYPLLEKIIAQDGAIISEYPPAMEASRFTFPARNRIISGLSLGVLIIEAGEKSGSLITANYALEQNREIFAVPGSIFSSQSIGTNSLIKQGAIPVVSTNDVLKALSLGFSASTLTNTSLPNFEDKLEEKIYKLLSFDPFHLDKIAKKLQRPSAEIAAKLSLMEIRGIVKNISGGFVRE